MNGTEIVNREENAEAIQEWLMGEASGSHYDGMCYRLMLGEDGILTVAQYVSSNEYSVGGEICVATHEGYCDLPAEDLITDPRDLPHQDWYGEAFDRLAEAIDEEIRRAQEWAEA